jgi:hypothetical protein
MSSNSDTAIRGRYGTQQVDMSPVAEFSATAVSLMALTERNHSDRAIPPRQNFLSLTLSTAECYILALGYCYILHAALSPYMFSCNI